MRLAIARCSLLALVLAVRAMPAAALPAFPGAQGFGAKATGGRGGQVLRVTTLATSGVGSLQWALNQPGPRIIVFRVSGVIEGDVNIPHGDVTIAGQTATGAGITIHGHLYSDFGDDTHNVIIRHLRVRPPDPDAEWPAAQHDAIQLSTAHTFILDHIDASHGADETIDAWGGAYDVTLQWSAVTYPIYQPPSWTHNTGIINHRACIDGGSTACTAGDPLGGRVSIHHNLFAHARNRTPALSTGPADVVNNVVYNGREGFVHHNIVGAASTSATAVGDFNIVGNWYIDGPSASLAPLWFDPENTTLPIPTRYYVFDNRVEHTGVFTGRLDNPFTTPGFDAAYDFYSDGIVASQFTGGPYSFVSFAGYVPITVHPTATVVDELVARVGALPRDVVNGWAVADLVGRSGAWGNRRPDDWLTGLTPGTPPVDNDADGMADSWEPGHGLNPANGGDHTTVMPSGYTAIEEYINEVADILAERLFADGFESGSTAVWSGVR